uniref:uncharacterized protein n=1 Tax=Myxine glutinosa TaxID=7769 RepID=UPI00358EC29A
MANRGAANPSLPPLLLLILLLLPKGSSEESQPRVTVTTLPKDRACPPGMFWATKWCSHCNCDPSEAVGAQCDSDGRCECSARFSESKCKSCTNGTFGPLGRCQPCLCNGHTRTCNTSGFCIHCGGNTTGPRCEHCLPGFYRLPSSLITMPCTKEECCPAWIRPSSNSAALQTPQRMEPKKWMKKKKKKSGKQFPAWDLPTVPPLMREGEILHTTNLGPTNGKSNVKPGVINVFNRTGQGVERARATMLSEVQRLSTMLITPFKAKFKMEKGRIATETAKWATTETSTGKATAMALSISVQKHATSTMQDNHAQKAQPSSKVNMDVRLTTTERVKMTELEKTLNATGRNVWATPATKGVALIAEGSVAEGMGLTTVGKEVESATITAGKVAKATATTAAGRVMEGVALTAAIKEEAASNAEEMNVGVARTEEGRKRVGTGPRVAGRLEATLATHGRVEMGVATTVPRTEAGTASVGAGTTTKGRMETSAAQTPEGVADVGAASTTEGRVELGTSLTEEGRPTAGAALTEEGRWEEALPTAGKAELAMTTATTRLKIVPTLTPSKQAKETPSEISATKPVLKTMTESLTTPTMLLLTIGGCRQLNQCPTDLSKSLSSPNVKVPHGPDMDREAAVPATKEILITDFKLNADQKFLGTSIKNTSSTTVLRDGLLSNLATHTTLGQGIHMAPVETERVFDSETDGFEASVSDISSTTSQTIEGRVRELSGTTRHAQFHPTVEMSTAHPTSILTESWTTSTVKTEIPTLQVITQSISTMEQMSVSHALESSSQVSTGVVRKATTTPSQGTMLPGQDISPPAGFKRKIEVVTQPGFGRGQEIDNQKEDPLRGGGSR